jgi:transposase
MARQRLDDTQWSKIELLLPGKAGDSGAKARDNRQ